MSPNERLRSTAERLAIYGLHHESVQMAALRVSAGTRLVLRFPPAQDAERMKLSPHPVAVTSMDHLKELLGVPDRIAKHYNWRW